MELNENVGALLRRNEARRRISVLTQLPLRYARFSDGLSFGAVNALSNSSYTFPSCPIVP